MISHYIDTLPAALRHQAVLGDGRANTRPDIHFMKLRNSLIRYRIAGKQGPALVIATDPPVQLEMYDELIELLAKDFRLVVFEAPGFGFSLPDLRFNFSMDMLVENLVEFLRRLELAPYTLAFPCVIGFCGIALANRFPQLVQRLVSIQQPNWANTLAWRRGRDPKAVLQKPVIGQLAMHALKKRRVGQWFDAAVARREMLESFVSTSRQGLENGACFCLASGFQAFLGSEQCPVHPVRLPSLVVWGDADRSHSKTDKSSTLDLLPEATVVHISEAGHFPELETAGRFAEAVGSFIEST